MPKLSSTYFFDNEVGLSLAQFGSMTVAHYIISDEELFARFIPIENPNGGGEGFEPMNKTDEAFVNNADPACVWTSIEVEDDDGNSGNRYISGIHHKDALLYIITKHPVTAGDTYETEIEWVEYED